MKLVFLDADGLFSSLYDKPIYGTNRHAMSHESWNPEAVIALNRLCTIHSDIRIIISSSWRKLPDGPKNIEWWNEQFKLANAPDIKVISITPSADNGFRGREINNWLQNPKNGVNTVLPMLQYVILDDDSDFYPEQPFYHINERIGYTELDTDFLIDYFNYEKVLPEITRYHPEAREINNDKFSLNWN